MSRRTQQTKIVKIVSRGVPRALVAGSSTVVFCSLERNARMEEVKRGAVASTSNFHVRPREEGSAVVFEPRGDLATCSLWIRSVDRAARLQYERNNSLGASESRHSGLKTTNLCLVSAGFVGTLMSTGIARSKFVSKDGVGALQGLDGSSCGFLG